MGLGPGLSVPEGLSGPAVHMGPGMEQMPHGMLKIIFSKVTVMKDGVVGLSLGTGWLGLG